MSSGGNAKLWWIRRAVGFRRTVIWLTGLLMLSCASAQQGPYPKPLVHTPADHPAAHIVLLSVDGLSAADLARWVHAHPQSAIAGLSARGVTYTNAHTPLADPAVGLIAMVTGGTPISTGIVRSESFDRSLSPPGSECSRRGAVLDVNADADAALSSEALPRDANHQCRPVELHELSRVNNIFEVVHSQVGRTAWAGDGLALTDLLRGRSGIGLDDSCSVALEPTRGRDAFVARHRADQRRVALLLGWFDGRDCNGRPASVPVLCGISLTEAAGSSNALAAVDDEIGHIVTKLRDRHLYDSTWIVIASPFATSSVLSKRRLIPLSEMQKGLNSVRIQTLHITGGSTAMIWLADPSQTDDAAASLARNAGALGIERIIKGQRLKLTWNDPEHDPRVPDLIAEAEPGVTWSAAGLRKVSSGGLRDDETHVALLVSGAQLGGREDKTPVPTTQLAPLLLRALGLEKFDLEALHREHTPALPGIF